jgi:hypothetical protein
MTAIGPGFEVSASWGAVRVPEEESEPSGALRLADARMYAQKESRRVAHDDFLEPSVTAAPESETPSLPGAARGR